MELFKLLGTIAIDNGDANKAIDDTTDKAEGAKGKFGAVFTKIGQGAVAVGKTIGVGLAAGATAMGGLTIKALNMSGELEQNLGGSEAVYKNFAGKMQEIGKTAFKDMGLSTSDFLGTANKMGALFQGAGFGIEESANLSAKAMQRAADVASIMGIDTKDAMEAVAGAAKGNFTMMDNLGVAMNDTAIQNYALSKGISKSTAEMSQQEKIGLAMEMFLDKTSYAAGNYAKENETLAGSLGTAKSALSNFLDGSGTVDDVVSSFSNAAGVIVKNVTELAPKLMSGITELINKIVPMLPPLLQSLLPGIIKGAVSLINGLVSAMPQIITALMDSLPALIDGIEQIFNALVSSLPQIMQVLCDALPSLLPQIINALISMILTLMKYLPQIIDPLIDNLPEILISVIDALMQNLPALIDGCIQLVIALVKALPQIMMAFYEATPTVFKTIIEGLWNSLPVLLNGIIEVLVSVGTAIWDTISGICSKVWEGVKIIFAPVGDFFKDIWEGIKNVFGVVVDWFRNIWEKVSNAIHTVIDPWIEIARRLWEKIKEIFTPVVEFFGNLFSKAWEKIKSVFAPVGDFFKGIWDGIKSAFGSVTDWFKDVFSKAWQAVKDVFSTGGKVFDGMKEGISDVFKTVVNAIIGGINKVISIPFNAINSMLDKLRNVSILGVSPFGWINTFNVPQIPKLFRGGVLKKGQTGYLEGDGDEAVVPLEKNTGWLQKVASKIHEFSLTTQNDLSGIVPVDQLATAIKFEIGQRIQNLETILTSVVDVLKEFFPQLLDAFDVTMVMDDGTLVAKLTPKIDKQLGIIYKRKERG